MSQTPSRLERLADYLLVRRSNQTIVALGIVAVLVMIGVWWIRNGGLRGKLAEYDESRPASSSKPSRTAAFIVNINTADVAELVELPGVGQAIAERIVEYRKQNGPFESVDELDRIPGIGPKTLEELRPHVKLK